MTSDRRTCIEGPAGCSSYASGHSMHWIHSSQVAKRPWGWRDGVVSALVGGEIEVDYVSVEGQATLWHHANLTPIVAVGMLVRVHEEFHALGGPFGWLNVQVVQGIGRIPTPDDTSAWTTEMRVAVTDLATGRAVAVDHSRRPDDTPTAPRSF